MLTAEQQDLAAEYVGLARGQAWSYYRKSTGLMDIDTCMSAALLGLVEALNRFPAYCAENNFDPSREDYRKAYLLKRIRGSILDAARSADHMTRSARGKAKALRAAEDDGARGDDELAVATGIDLATVRRVQADALVPVSLDDQDVFSGAAYAGSAVADIGAGTESQAAVNDLLGAFLAAFDLLPPVQQVLLAFVFHQELDITVAAKAVYLEPAEARQQLEAAVCQLHREMLKSVS